jgi:hypothetical protein
MEDITKMTRDELVEFAFNRGRKAREEQRKSIGQSQLYALSIIEKWMTIAYQLAEHSTCNCDNCKSHRKSCYIDGEE